jgi:hypothetical protein
MKYIYTLILGLMLISQQTLGLIVVPLGYDCTGAGVLHALGFRKAAYPFDWMLSNFESVYKAIKDDFKMFLDPATLRVSDNRHDVIDFYGLQLVHDFPTATSQAAVDETTSASYAHIRDDWRQFIEPIREKYQRRINRLRDVFASPDQVLFVRYLTNKTEAIRLRDLLAHMYPNLNFTLLALRKSPDIEPDWGLEKIRNFSVINWVDDSFATWRNVFNTLGIDPIHARFFDEDDMVCDGTCQKYRKNMPWQLPVTDQTFSETPPL